ncbi:major facilitator superfamily domain-containing protein [Naematelia encephala]|uniref:Major facilitator superfamily domain-containing protein n=1 Tax=Naematelia encephala TaxID=71784 RepID=A0A1Y2AM85_9TREE|nr:major facilitator superfamily domain-containing protein [Naematelia encephala]
MVNKVNLLSWLYQEFGLESVYRAGPNAWLIILSRSSRMFAYGAASIIIALLFSALEFSDFRIGLFMTLTLVGDVILTLLLTLVADKVGRRRTLLLGSFLMVLSGVIFMVSDSYWILVIAAVVGVVSATGSDFGPFRAIEESIVSQLTTTETRSNVLTWYVTSASLGSAIGTEASGRVVDALKAREGWTIVDAYHGIFGVYVVMGLLNMACVGLMTERTEADHGEKQSDVVLEEVEPLTLEGRLSVDDSTNAVPPKQSTFAQISKKTRSVMFKLWPLLIVDSLADGMVGYSLTTYYMERRFHIATSTLGDITSISYFLSAGSTIFSGPLANRLGLINTMVFTHLPSSAAVLLFPLAPNLALTIVLFFIRTGLNNMDQAPRAAFIAAAVQPSERTAVMGITSMLRTLAATTGPSVTGWLAESDQFWIAFVLAGSLRIAYDCGLWALFVNMKIQ